MSLNEVVNILIKSPWFYVGVSLIVLMIFYSMYRNSQRKSIHKKVDDLLRRYSSIKTGPLLYKLNKSAALSRVNKDIAEQVLECQGTFDNVQEELKEVYSNIAECDDCVAVKKLAEAKKYINVADELLVKAEEKVSGLNEVLDGIIRQESDQREQINSLKDEFRELKQKYNERSDEFVYSYETIERKLIGVEKQFSEFEEQIYASEFQKAAEIKEEVKNDVKQLQEVYSQLPELLEIARGILPRMLEEVNTVYAYAKQRGVHLKHVDVEKNVQLINERMKADLNSLKSADVLEIGEHLDDCKKRISQLLQQLEKEGSSFEEVSKIKELLTYDIKSMDKGIRDINAVYKVVSSRFGFSNVQDVIDELSVSHDKFNKRFNDVTKKNKANEISSTEMLLALRELKHDVDLKTAEMKVLQEKLEHARHDENHAKNQLLKLHLIINEMKSKVRKNRLASISENYEEDLQTAYSHVLAVENILEEVPLDISLLNTTLKTAIDFVYLLYNDVNKILGTANMVEAAIVVGNRCRSTYEDIDSELTLSELSYRNGEYTKALTIAWKSLDTVFPNSQDLIKESAAQK